MICLDLPKAIVASVEAMAGRAGMTASSWLSDQICHAYSTGLVTPEPSEPRRRPSRPSSRRANRTATETSNNA